MCPTLDYPCHYCNQPRPCNREECASWQMIHTYAAALAAEREEERVCQSGAEEAEQIRRDRIYRRYQKGRRKS